MTGFGPRQLLPGRIDSWLRNLALPIYQRGAAAVADLVVVALLIPARLGPR